jgi:D-inositol-3-phosphate glycosyltransferase
MISVHASPAGRLGTRDTGGMSVYIRELAAAIAARGHAVDIFTRAASTAAAGRALPLAAGVRLIPLDLGAPADLPKAALAACLDRFFGSLERFRSAERRGYDLIHSHYWLSGMVGRAARAAWAVPHLTTFHTLGALKELACGAGSEPAGRIAAERELCAAADRILVASDRERDNLLRYYGAAPGAVSTVPCGVDLKLFRPVAKGIARRRLGLDPRKPMLLYVGRFAPEKGLARLVRAVAGAASLSDLGLLVAGGDGGRDPAVRRMRALSRQLGLEGRVRFAGRVEQRELPSYYSAAEALVLPSAYESFGMVALEAMACGTPVVATRVGAMEAIVRPGETGELAEGFDPDSLAEAVAAWRLRAAARPPDPLAIRRTVLGYAWDRVAEGVLGIYGELREGRTSAPAVRPESPRPSCCGCGRGGRG